MFMLTMGPGMNFGFPDVCLTPGVPPIPVPYPNLQTTSVSTPLVPNITVDAMPAMNLLCKGMVSNGDEAGALTGVASHMLDGPTTYLAGCATIFLNGAPAQRLTSVTGQNCMGMLPNAPGMTIAPSQVTVLTLG